MPNTDNRIYVPINRNLWSRESQVNTCQSVETLLFYIFMNEQHRCHRKFFRFTDDHSYGFISLQNDMECRCNVESEDYPEKLHYRDVDGLVNDGWVLD